MDNDIERFEPRYKVLRACFVLIEATESPLGCPPPDPRSTTKTSTAPATLTVPQGDGYPLANDDNNRDANICDTDPSNTSEGRHSCSPVHHLPQDHSTETS